MRPIATIFSFLLCSLALQAQELKTIPAQLVCPSVDVNIWDKVEHSHNTEIDIPYYNKYEIGLTQTFQVDNDIYHFTVPHDTTFDKYYIHFVDSTASTYHAQIRNGDITGGMYIIDGYRIFPYATNRKDYNTHGFNPEAFTYLDGALYTMVYNSDFFTTEDHLFPLDILLKVPYESGSDSQSDISYKPASEE